MNEQELQPYFFAIQKIAKQRRLGVFLVGGFLRDLLLKRESRDLDFAVERNAVFFAKKFAQDTKGVFVLLDQEHGCGRVVKKQNGKIYTFDFADFRSSTLKKDLLCRDFTINTLAFDAAAGQADLPAGIIGNPRARKDLSAKVIQMVSAKAFQQDPLRLLRAFALRAALGFSIEQKTLARIKKDRALIRNVSAERIREELFKILESDRAGVVLKQMDRVGLLEYVIPQVRIMFGVKQGTYHHLDVWRHALESVKQVEDLVEEFFTDAPMIAYLNTSLTGGHTRKALLKLACLLHDVGKPETRRREGDRIRFHGHEHAGRAISYAVAKHLKLSRKQRHTLCDMVQMHLRPGYLSNFKRPSDKAVFRYFHDTKDEAVSIALLAMADQRSTRGPMTTAEEAAHHDKVCRVLIERYFQQQNEQPLIPLINGDDLIQLLGLKPSPIFSKILREVEEQQATLKIATKEQALEAARKIAMNHKDNK
jgi:putative nucleotidyltransferase with HDIG domain